MPDPFAPLNQTEKHILLMIADGSTNRQIAAALHFAPGTVRNYVSHILEKTGCENRATLAVFAVRNNLQGTKFWEITPPQTVLRVDYYDLELL